VTHLLMVNSLRFSWFNRLGRMFSPESLDQGLLINREDQGILRRIKVQALI